jgi:hypothetical protein
MCKIVYYQPLFVNHFIHNVKSHIRNKVIVSRKIICYLKKMAEIVTGEKSLIQLVRKLQNAKIASKSFKYIGCLYFFELVKTIDSKLA